MTGPVGLTERSPAHTRSAATRVWVEVMLLFLLALIVRLHLITDVPRLEHPPSWDEMYHLLAARSWAEEGSFAVGNGEYPRGALYTMALGGLFWLFGEDVILARAFSVAAGSLLVAAVFLWARREAGALAAWLGAGMLAVAPIALHLSQFIRFYSWQALLFWLGAVGVYALVMRRMSWPTTALLGLATAALFAVALHLQLVTLIGLAALAGWAAIELAGRAAAGRYPPSLIKWTLALLTGFVLAGAALAYASGFVGRLLEVASWTPPNVGLRGDLRYYHWLLVQQYPTLWTLVPLAILVAVARKPRAGLFCACMFAFGLVIHTIPTAKSERYISYLLPFFFVLWGIVLAEVVPVVQRFASEAAEKVLKLRLGPVLSRAAGGAGLAVVGGFVLISNPAFPLAYHMLRGGPAYAEEGQPIYWWREAPRWAAAAEVLRPLAERVEVVATTSGMPALYYLGRYDVDVSENRRLHVQAVEDKEFGFDRRSGGHVITTAESLRLVVACFRTGLFVAPDWEWDDLERKLGPQLHALLAGAERLELPRRWRLHAYSWAFTEAPTPRECASLPATLWPPESRAKR